MPFITIAGQQQIAKKQGDNATLNITQFILANVPDLGGEPATRIESIPSAGYIVDQLSVTKSGYVNTNQVVYSLVMGSNIGNYQFNWVGLVDDEGVLIAVTYVPLTEKNKNDGAVAGNTITRNFLISYSGIQQATSINVSAETWQIDFNARLSGIDERERLANLDIYGHEGFLSDGWKVTGSAGTYSVAAGIGYVGGIRVKNATEQQITTNVFPNEIWLNVSLQGDISDVTAFAEFVIDTGPFADYVDGNGIEHYLTKIAELDASGAVIETREMSYLKDIKSSNSKNLFDVSGDENDIVLTSKAGTTKITELNDYDEFSFIVAATNTGVVTIKIDGLADTPLAGVVSDTQIFETALLTVRYAGGAFYIASQVNPKTGNGVLDIGKLYTDTVDISRSGEYALDGASYSREAHSIAFAIVSASSNYIDQVTKDSSPIEYGGYYGSGDGSTTFTLPMVGGEFIRMFDDGRGIDNGRVFGSWQEDAIRNITGTVSGTHAPFRAPEGAFSVSGTNPYSVSGQAGSLYSENLGFDASKVVPTADQNRPRSIAYFGKTRL